MRKFSDNSEEIQLNDSDVVLEQLKNMRKEDKQPMQRQNRVQVASLGMIHGQ